MECLNNMKHAKRRKGLGAVLLVTAAVLMAVLGSVCAYNHLLNSFSGKADMYNMQISNVYTASLQCTQYLYFYYYISLDHQHQHYIGIYLFYTFCRVVI